MWNIWGLEVLRAWLGADEDRELELREQVDYATRRANAAAHDRDEAERQRSVAAAEVPPQRRLPRPSRLTLRPSRNVARAFCRREVTYRRGRTLARGSGRHQLRCGATEVDSAGKVVLVGKVAAIAAETNAAVMKIFDLKTDADVARAAAADHTLPRATLRIRPRSKLKDFSRS